MEQIQISKIKEIYNLLEDDLSKYIFENRLMFSLTEDMLFIRNIVCTRDVCRELYERMKAVKDKTIGIFGAGMVGRSLVRTYRDIEIECFIDNKQAGIECERLPVISLSEFKGRYPNSIVVISTKLYYKEIVKQLLEEGFQEEQIINIGMEYEKINHLQYFDLPQLENKRLPEEVFIDGGSYNGNTSMDFIKWSPGGLAIAWEPNPDNQEKCKQLLKENKIRYELIPKGLWSEEGELKLTSARDESKISDEGDVKIKVDSIDNLINKPVTFIKMDIEGSEYQALLGAKKTILKYKPKLAICIYHKPEDIWELPWLIHEINPEYKLYLRHYSFADNETVLYAL